MAQTRTEEKVLTPGKPKWECQIAGEPKDPKGFTVGEKFNVACKGDALSLTPPIKIKLTEKSQYTIVLLEPVEVSSTELSYKATGYRPGEYKFDFLEFVDANGNGFISQPMQWKTASILDPANPQQQGFGPIQPMPMAWPMWILFSGVIAFMVLVGWLLVFLRRRDQQKRLEQNIRKYQSPLGSYHQFSKDIRLLKRGVVFSSHIQWSEPQIAGYLEQLNQHLSMFILREYVVPADRWSVSNILKHMKQKNRVAYSKYAPDVIKAFKELDRASGQVASIKPMDLEQITAICSHAVESMWKSRKVGAK